MTTNANITKVNSEHDLENLVDGTIVLVNIHFLGGYSPTTPMLHEKITKKGFFGTKQGHRFIRPGGSLPNAFTWWEIYENKDISFNDGTVSLKKERVRIGYILPRDSLYTQKESQLRQAGLYHG